MASASLLRTQSEPQRYQSIEEPERLENISLSQGDRMLLEICGICKTKFKESEKFFECSTGHSFHKNSRCSQFRSRREKICPVCSQQGATLTEHEGFKKYMFHNLTLQQKIEVDQLNELKEHTFYLKFITVGVLALIAFKMLEVISSINN